MRLRVVAGIAMSVLPTIATAQAADQPANNSKAAAPAPAHSEQFASIVQRATEATELTRLIVNLTDDEAKTRLGCHKGSGPDPSSATFLAGFARGPVKPEHLDHPPPLDTILLAQYALRTLCPGEKAAEGKPSTRPERDVGAIPDAVLTGLGVQSAILNGLTTFLLDRARDELVLSFIDRLSKVDHATKTLLMELMPASWTLVANVSTIGYGSLVPALRAAFTRDMDSLPVRVVERVPDAQSKTMLRIGVRTALNLRNGVSPAAALAELASVDLVQVTDPRLTAAVRRVGILAREYRANASQTDMLAQDAAGRRMLVTYFVADELDDQRFASAAVALDFVQQRSADVIEMIDRLRELQTTVDELKKRLSEMTAIPADAYVTVIRQSAQVIASGRGLVSVTSASETSQLEDLLGYVSTITELYASVVARDYQQVMLGAVALASKTREVIPVKVSRYLAFASTIASAQNAEQVNQALRTAALPVGSYRTKRRGEVGASPLSLTVNGYVGLGAGEETVRVTSGTALSRYASPAVPFGLELSGALKYLSVGAFVPLIDLGTLASTRFREDASVNQEPEVGFAQVFAPGLFFVVGISSSIPLTVGAGYQQVPKLRETTDGAKMATRRWAFFAAVDVPVFRF